MNVFKIVLMFIFLLLIIYIGVGGMIILENDQRYQKFDDDKNIKSDQIDTTKFYVYDSIQFSSKEKMLAYREQYLAEQIFPYLDKLPSFLNFFLTSISFGIIGAFSKVINDSIKKGEPPQGMVNLFLIVTQGGLIGIIVLSISYIVPALLIADGVQLKPLTIVLLSLLGGVFYLEFFEWLESRIRNNIQKPDKKTDE